MKKTPWIVVTGLDGSGKTTLVDMLEEHLTKNGLRVKRTRSPHDKSFIGELLNVSGDGDTMKDRYTDRLIFALDNRILGTRIRQWMTSGEYDIILSQRGFFDSFVHGSVQGYTYEQIAALNQIEDLPKCSLMFHLCTDSTIAYQRIKNDENANKFRNPQYMQKQEEEIRRGYRMLTQGNNPDLAAFRDIPNFFIDTTSLTKAEIFGIASTRISDFLKIE